MSPKLKEIEQYLIKLELKTDKIPTFADLKKNFRDQLHLHPDRAGKESTKDFQEITEAARKIFFFLVENQDLHKRKSEECKGILKCFEKESQLTYNEGSIVFLIENEMFDAWMKSLEEKHLTG